MSTKEFPQQFLPCHPSALQRWAGVGTEPRKKEVELPLLPRKRDMKFYLCICIFVLQTESDLKSTADVIFSANLCLCVVPGSPSLRNLGTNVGCGALSVTALCQLLLRNQQHIPRKKKCQFLPVSIKKKKNNPTQKCLKSLCTLKNTWRIF